MRGIILFFVIPFSYADYEYKISAMRYRWWDVASFPVTLHTIGYVKNINGLELSLRHGKSTVERNELDTAYRDIDGQITHFWSGGLGGRYDYKRLGFIAGLIYTEYKEFGKPDTDFGYYIGMGYRLNRHYSLSLTKDVYYTKDKVGYGREITEGLGLAVTYKQ